jgi:hypothetical protein
VVYFQQLKSRNASQWGHIKRVSCPRKAIVVVLNQMTFSGFRQYGHIGVLPAGASSNLTSSRFSINDSATLIINLNNSKRMAKRRFSGKEKRPDTTPASQRELSVKSNATHRTTLATTMKA